MYGKYTYTRTHNTAYVGTLGSECLTRVLHLQRARYPLDYIQIEYNITAGTTNKYRILLCLLYNKSKTMLNNFQQSASFSPPAYTNTHTA